MLIRCSSNIKNHKVHIPQKFHHHKFHKDKGKSLRFYFLGNLGIYFSLHNKSNIRNHIDYKLLYPLYQSNRVGTGNWEDQLIYLEGSLCN